MRHLFALVMLTVCVSTATAQTSLDPYTATVGPAYGYTAQGGRAIFSSIAGKPDTLYYPFGGGLAVPEDDGYATISMPFDFRFFGGTIAAGNPVFASANGFMVFGATSTTVVPVNLLTEPASFGNQPAIVPLFTDLVARGMQMGGPGLYVQVTGTDGNRRMSVEWSSMQHFNENQNTRPVSFQIHLFEADGSILFNYESTIFGMGADNGRMATVGIRDTTFDDPPTDVLQWGYHNDKDNFGHLLGDDHFQISFGFAAAVPEPASIALVSLGATGIAGTVWYRRRQEARRKNGRFSKT
ncbi:MAG TPA: PEP-CTERM sorting domain-containing protein [Gemmatales bacterium]|nr:PEP-CTERM sorting domain-containing protein [Gemmatales bacterium]